jgi:hypothetical protein
VSTWNYRVVRRGKEDTGHYHSIAECYYPEGSEEVDGYAYVEPGGDTVEDLRADLGYMLEALDRPVIEEADLP